MRTAEERQLEKELKNKQKIAEAIVAIDEAIANFENFARTLDDDIDEAFLQGDDELAEELLQCQADMEEMAREFKYIKTSIRSMANMTLAFSSIAKLPSYIKGCNKVLRGIPSLRGISRGFGDLRRNVGRFRQQIRGMRDDLRSGKGKRYADIYTGTRQHDADTLARCRERSEARLAARFGGAYVPSTATAGATATASAPATATATAGATYGGGAPAAPAGAAPTSPAGAAPGAAPTAGGAGIDDLLGMMNDVNGGGNGAV